MGISFSFPYFPVAFVIHVTLTLLGSSLLHPLPSPSAAGKVSKRVKRAQKEAEELVRMIL